ncbi:MAG: methyltransferase domain-containing protein [Lentisphaerae bacterium]|nr:methyltransferase domain-containing protein [Lentisphaerota bacterium]
MISQIHTPSEHGFPETADIDTASDDYATRFAGPAGAWMLEVQERITLGFVARSGARTILDVGGGHGQLAAPLCREGYDVTVLGSDARCRRRIAGIADSGNCRFVVGNVIALPFPDRSFDMAISFRLLTHCSRWPELAGELCRVARAGIIVDYPTSQSVNVIAPGLFQLKKKVETNTRAWALFRHAEVLREFERHGFRKRARKAQFFLPMVLHRMLKSRGLSAALEGACRGLGLTALAGSPAILWLARNNSETRAR